MLCHNQAKSLRFINDASAVVFSHSCCAFKKASAQIGEKGELSCASSQKKKKQKGG